MRRVNRDFVSKRIKEIESQLGDLQVSSLSLFGSAARGESGPDSDLDFLVEFKGMATLDGYMDLKELLENTFKVKIDLVTMRALKEAMRDSVLKEAVRVA